MASQLPKANRVGGQDRRMTYILVGIVGVLIVAVAVLLFGGGIFNQQPKSTTERDYILLLEGLKKHPNDPSVLMTIAEREFTLGKKTEALGHAEKAATLATSTAGIPMRYAQLLVQVDKAAEAKKWVEKDLKIDGDANRTEPRFLLAQILFDLGKKDEGLKMMASTLKVDYQAADMRITYADMLAKAGKKKEAIAQYNEAMRYLPNDPRALAGLERLGVSTQPTKATVTPHGSTTPTPTTGTSK